MPRDLPATVVDDAGGVWRRITLMQARRKAASKFILIAEMLGDRVNPINYVIFKQERPDFYVPHLETETSLTIAMNKVKRRQKVYNEVALFICEDYGERRR